MSKHLDGTITHTREHPGVAAPFAALQKPTDILVIVAASVDRDVEFHSPEASE